VRERPLRATGPEWKRVAASFEASIRPSEKPAVGELRSEASGASNCNVQCRVCRQWARLGIRSLGTIFLWPAEVPAPSPPSAPLGDRSAVSRAVEFTHARRYLGHQRAVGSKRPARSRFWDGVERIQPHRRPVYIRFRVTRSEAIMTTTDARAYAEALRHFADQVDGTVPKPVAPPPRQPPSQGGGNR
jgi:hypothetical protein